MSSKTFRYVGTRYRQGKSTQDIVTFCATAQDIRAWAGVPTKTERFHGGFQRALTDRYKKISDFFQAGNSSPTSIVVAFRSGALAFEDLTFPSSWPNLTTGLSALPTFTQLTFHADDVEPDAVDLDALCGTVSEMLRRRIEDSGDQPSADGSQADDGSAEDDLTAIDETESDGGSDDGDAVLDLDVGQSKLRAFYDFLTDRAAVRAWLDEQNARREEILAKGARGRSERDFIQIEPESRLRAALVSLLKPAMIVDGQHRVTGAYNAEGEPIVFNVCAIKDADWVEQVFQFVVLNKLAKPISSSFLTALLNTSLTNSEVGRITDRLKMVGLADTDRLLMKAINFDARSPFYGMVSQPGDMAGVSNRGTLSDKGMLGVARRWYAISAGPNSAAELEMFMPAIGEDQLGKARAKWRAGEGLWSPFFFAFWSVIRDRYNPEGAWQQGSGFNLLYIVTLQTLQNMFLEKKREADVKFADIEDFKDQVRKFFEKVPGGLFLAWSATGLQSGQGPSHIEKAVEEMRRGRQLAKVKEDSPLFQKR